MNRKPKYAVISLTDNVNIGQFFNLLIANGYNNVTFLSSLAEHADVKKLLRSETNGKRLEENAETEPIFKGETSLLLEPKTTEIINVSATVNVIPSTSTILPTNNDIFLESDVMRSAKQSQAMDTTNCISCKLCDNKIMVTRLSNLTNHVRRHSSVKQYSCVYCQYQHNEMSKVRTHMAGQHMDSVTSPNDNLTPELQKIWCAYMEKCFPGYLDSQGKSGRSALDVFGGRSLARLEGVAISLEEEVVTLTDKLHNCVECGDAVSGEGESDEQFTEHILHKHADICQPYKCGECGWLAAYEYTVRGHIASRHAIIAADVSVSVQETCNDYSLFVGKFFPSLERSESVTDISEELQAFVENQHKVEDYLEKLNESIPAEKLLSFETSDGNEELSNGEQSIECSICSSSFPMTAIEAMMAHVKDHYAIKQFECPICSFGSNDFDEVELHLTRMHDGNGTIIDQNSDLMQQAWLITMKRCFSDLMKHNDNDSTGKPLKKRSRHL